MGAPTPLDTTREDVLVAQMGPIEVVTESLLDRTWTLVSFDRPYLFTSDEPVTDGVRMYGRCRNGRRHCTPQ